MISRLHGQFSNFVTTAKPYLQQAHHYLPTISSETAKKISLVAGLFFSVVSGFIIYRALFLNPSRTSVQPTFPRTDKPTSDEPPQPAPPNNNSLLNKEIPNPLSPTQHERQAVSKPTDSSRSENEEDFKTPSQTPPPESTDETFIQSPVFFVPEQLEGKLRNLQKQEAISTEVKPKEEETPLRKFKSFFDGFNYDCEILQNREVQTIGLKDFFFRFLLQEHHIEKCQMDADRNFTITYRQEVQLIVTQLPQKAWDGAAKIPSLTTILSGLLALKKPVKLPRELKGKITIDDMGLKIAFEGEAICFKQSIPWMEGWMPTWKEFYASVQHFTVVKNPQSYNGKNLLLGIDSNLPGLPAGNHLMHHPYLVEFFHKNLHPEHYT